MSANLTFTDDELASVEFKIFFTKRDLESLLYRGEVVVTKAMDQNGFIAWRIAEFVSKTLPNGIVRPAKWIEACYPPAAHLNAAGQVVSLPSEDYQYLRATGEKAYVSPRERGNYQERQTRAIERILERI